MTRSGDEVYGQLAEMGECIDGHHEVPRAPLVTEILLCSFEPHWTRGMMPFAFQRLEMSEELVWFYRVDS